MLLEAEEDEDCVLGSEVMRQNTNIMTFRYSYLLRQ